MSVLCRGLGWVAAALAALCALPAGATAQEPLLQMAAVQVFGGESAWHAAPTFRLDWTQEPGPAALAGAVDYRLYDPQGTPISKTVRNIEVVNALGHISVPPVPGAYRIEAWLENLAGEAGPHVTAALRFDDAPPSAAVPLPVPGWRATGKPVALTIEPAPAPYPLSGIQGYAVAVDAEPCAASTWCSPGEIDLPAGAGEISLGPLPEGVHAVRVAAVSGSGVPSRVEGTEVRVDGTAPATVLEGLPAGWSRRPVQVTAVSHDELSGLTPSQWGLPFTLIEDGGEQVAYASGDRATALIGGNGVHELGFYGRDVAGNVADGQLGAAAPGHAVLRIDREPPAVVFVPGQDPAEPERIEAVVTDPLSGPSQGQGSIAVRQLGSGAEFEALPARVESGRLVAHWDSDTYPPGAYEFRAIGYDVAGNSAAARLRGDGRPMVLPNPLKTPVRIASGLGAEPGSWGRGKRVAYGRWVRYGGRLRTADGTPVSDAEVTVTETFAAGSAPPARTTLTRTRADGSFSLRLPPGPSREVSASFGGTRVLTRAAGSSQRLRVRGVVRLRASSATARIGGAPVVFSGRVGRLGTASLAGKTVELQFRYPGAPWSEFRTVETNAVGHFRYAYRFSDDDSRGVRFQFRAVVPAQEGWPYDTGASHPVIVTGR